MTARVLVVERDPGVRRALRAAIESLGYPAFEASTGPGAVAAYEAAPVPVVIAGLPLPKIAGMDLLRRLSSQVPTVRFLVFSATQTELEVREVVRAGAFDWLQYPLDQHQLRAAVRRAFDSGLTPNLSGGGEGTRKADLQFVSDSMRDLAKLAARVAVHDVTVLITGESGTGKERIADLIVRSSRRADKTYLRFNCASLSAELAEAELFGHSRGAFTGAVRARPGLFGEADGGTLLLDEIGELGLSAQGKLLRVLQEGEIKPVGEERSRKVDVRILAATHRDLQLLCEQGTFRKDLFYRLNVVQLKTVPLRERSDDIDVIARHTLERCRTRFDVELLDVPQGLFERLRAYNWPGNVRELENAIEHMVVLSAPGTLDLSLLPTAAEPLELAELTLKQRLDVYERGLIAKALTKAGYRRSLAAALLGISRVTLYEKLQKFGLAAARGREDADVAL